MHPNPDTRHLKPDTRNPKPDTQSSSTPKISVLHTRVVTGTGGGPEKTILNSPRFMVDSRYNMKIAYLHPPDDPGFDELQRRAELAGTELIGIPDRGIRDFSVYRKLLRLCRDLDVKIWHGHDYKTNFIGAMLRRRHKMKLVTTVHGWVRHTKRTPLYYWVDRMSLRFYDRVICVSEDLKARCLQSGVKAERCSVIENAIDCEQYRRTKSTDECKRQMGFSQDRLTIGAVGRLSKEKGFDLLINAITQLVKQGHNLELVIAGEGDEQAALQTQIAQQPEPDRFRLLGYISDMPTFYQGLDIFVLSSLREGLPNVILEAMAYELPIVATRVAAVPSLLEEGQHGVLIEINNRDALIDGLKILLNDKSNRLQLAKSARQHIEDNYDFRVRMQKMKHEYDCVLGTMQP